MSKTVGIQKIIVGGVEIDVEKGSKVVLGGYQKNEVKVNGKTHYSEEWVSSEITCTTVLKQKQRINDLFARGEKEVQVINDTGQSWTFPDAFVSNRPGVGGNGDGGKIEVKIFGGSYVELIDG